MDSLLIDALLTGVGVIAFGLGHLVGRKKAIIELVNLEPEEDPEFDDIPLIEIDGVLVPHPTIVARRQKRDRLNG